MAQAGIYNLHIHLEQVLKPVLDNHWRLGEIEGLSDEAKQARADIYEHIERLERIVARQGEPMGPAKDDPSDDPPGAV